MEHWLEAWRCGEWVPHAAMLQYPELMRICSQETAIFSVGRDAYRRKV